MAQVSDVAHGPLVLLKVDLILDNMKKVFRNDILL
jgi:hypothetical protein